MIARIISALLIAFSGASALAQTEKPIQLAPDAPDRHVVQRGDTLWGIAGRFMRDPWRWPDIWRLNRDQIRNPHLIYPGQVVILDTSSGEPRLKLGEPVKVQPRIYSEPSRVPIPSIPSQVIEPFLSEPLIIEADGMAGVAKIVASQEGRVFLGRGDIAYASGVLPGTQVWQVFRPARPILDPATNEILGHEAYFLGDAKVVRDGEPATLQIVNAREEIGPGDRMVPLVKPDVVSYAPRSPEKRIDGHVVSLYNGVAVGETGRTYIVMLDRGKQDGLEFGHVLALYRGAHAVTYKGAVSAGRDTPYSGTTGSETKQTFEVPEERIGLVFVFRTFNRLSYGLVMDAERPVQPYDTVRNP